MGEGELPGMKGNNGEKRKRSFTTQKSTERHSLGLLYTTDFELRRAKRKLTSNLLFFFLLSTDGCKHFAVCV